MPRNFPSSQSEEAQACAGGWLSGCSGVQNMPDCLNMPECLHVSKVAIRFYVGSQFIFLPGSGPESYTSGPVPVSSVPVCHEVRRPGRLRFKFVLAWTDFCTETTWVTAGFPSVDHRTIIVTHCFCLLFNFTVSRSVSSCALLEMRVG